MQRRMYIQPVILALAMSAVLFACSGEEPGTPTAEPGIAEPHEGAPEAVYQLERRTEIRVELSTADWDALRYEGRSPEQLSQEEPTDYEYNEYFGTVTLDGVVYEDVELKKKGFIGSVSALRPSLRLDFKRGGVDIETGLRRLTLNADVQDRTHVRQCMAFDLFARAGLPSSRCALAHVFVNGKDLGTYTVVEPVREPMLRRHFSDGDGNLYEGTLADFDEKSWERIEVKTNESKNDRSDLRALVDALKESDDKLVSALTPLLDLDRFRDFWALETLIGHWDGYAETANNYYLYRDPGTGQFVFIPWGLDQAFTGERPFAVRPYDPVVYAGATLTRRLYGIEEQRDLFRQRLAELNNTLWDVPKLLAQSRTIAALAPDAHEPAVAQHEEFLRTHSAAVRSALEQPPTPLEDLQEVGPPPPRGCVGNRPIVADFESTWGQLPGAASVQVEVDVETPTSGFLAATGDAAEDSPQAALSLFTPDEEEHRLFVVLLMPNEQVRPGTHPFHALETFGLVARIGPEGLWFQLGFVGDGHIHFDEASREDGARIAGRVEGVLYQTACFAPELTAEGE